ARIRVTSPVRRASCRHRGATSGSHGGVRPSNFWLTSRARTSSAFEVGAASGASRVRHLSQNEPTGDSSLSEGKLLERFDSPSWESTPMPLWWWSGESLELERLLWQLDTLADAGIRQVGIINLAPTGPANGVVADDPAFMSERWWELLEEVCAQARRRE